MRGVDLAVLWRIGDAAQLHLGKYRSQVDKALELISVETNTLAINSPRLSLKAKKNFRPAIVAFGVIRRGALVDQVHLEAPQVLGTGRVRRGLEYGGQRASSASMARLRLGLERADPHVLNPALTQC